MTDASQKKITKTQARYLARKSTPLSQVIAPEHTHDTASEEIISVAPLLDAEDMSAFIEEKSQSDVLSDIAQHTETEPQEIVAPIEILETTAPTPVPIKKGVQHKRSRKLIAGEHVNCFVESLKRERIELIDALCSAGFNHNRFALGNDGYAEEVRHEVHTALTIGEWSVTSLLEWKEFGFRSWRDIAEEVAQVSIIQKDVLTDTLFDAVVRSVTLYPSSGTKEMMRRSLISTLLMRQPPSDAPDGLRDFLAEVCRVYFSIQKGAHFSPYEYALIAAVYAYYGDTPPNTVSHEVVHSGGWTGLKKTLLKGGSMSTVEQLTHSPKSEKYPLPDIATLPRTFS